MWTIFKVSIQLVTILLLFWLFGPEACGISAPGSGIEHTSPALEGEVLTSRPPGMSLHAFLGKNLTIYFFPHKLLSFL